MVGTDTTVLMKKQSPIPKQKSSKRRNKPIKRTMKHSLFKNPLPDNGFQHPEVRSIGVRHYHEVS
jgi:hypothetical protein